MAFVVRDNYPVQGCIAWENVHIAYEGQTYTIQDGYTSYKFVWWDHRYPNQFIVGDELPTLTEDDCLVFLNKNGTHLTVPNTTIIDGSLIVPESILTNALAANCVTSEKIIAGAITADKIAANAVGAEAIAAGSILGDHIVADSITGDKIAARTITANNIAVNTITADSGVIANGAITNAMIANLDASKITSGYINAARIQADSITVDKLASNVGSLLDISSNQAITMRVTQSQLNEAINEIEVGGRNLLLDSTFNEGKWARNSYTTILPPEPDKPNSSIMRLYHVNDTGNTNVNSPIWNNNRIYLEPREGDKITFSFDFYCEDSSVAPAGTIATFRRFSEQTGGSAVQSIFGGSMNTFGIGGVYGRWVRAKYTYTFTSNTAVAGWYAFGVYMSNSVSSGSSETRVADYKYREIKIEHGDKATDWTPAPEDINQAINTVDTKIDNRVSEINLSLDDITQRVSSVESSVSTIDDEVSSLGTRVSSAEQKITPTAIVSTVRQSTAYQNDLNGKVSKNNIISEINQSAEEVQINANRLKIGAGTTFEQGEIYTWERYIGMTWNEVIA